LLAKINKRPYPHRDVILYWYGLNGYQKLPDRKIALRLGLSRYRVQKIHDEAVEMLKSDM